MRKILLASLLALVWGKNILRETGNHHERPDYVRGSRAHTEHMHQVTIGIQQRNLDIIEKKLYEVSDMASPKYGQHLSFEEVGNLVANPEATEAVTRWLRENRVNIVHTSTYGEYIVAQAPIRTLEKMFEAEFYEFSVADFVHEASRTLKTPLSVQDTVIRAPSYSIPDYLSHYIAGLMDITSLPTPLRPAAQVKKVSNDHGESLLTSAYATPITLTNYYNIYGDGYGKGNQTTYQSLNQAFLPSDISAFQTYFGLPKRAVDKIYGLQVPSGSSCLGSNGANNCAEASLDLQYILAVAKNVSTTYWYDVGNDYNFKNFIINVSSFAHPSLVFSISYGSYEYYISTSEISFWNTEAMKLGLRGVTIVVASGDDGVTGFLFRSYPGSYPISQCGYYASWPASSPYVTAVGGTRYGLDTGSAEIVNQASNGGTITSGGGFSNSVAAPSFQAAAIASYFTKYTATQSSYRPYNSNNRGYPDISLASESYLVYIGGVLYLLSGTSASCPTFAGFVSLVNGMRLVQGGSSLGWINPSIYANNGDFVKVDITSGDNKCTASSSYCCTSVGFAATTGWDPVTGFGSVDFTKFASYFMSGSSSANPTASPSAKPTVPTASPSAKPTANPSAKPSAKPSCSPTAKPSAAPSASSTANPSAAPSANPSNFPIPSPTAVPTSSKTSNPSSSPSVSPSQVQSVSPSLQPSAAATNQPIPNPSAAPTAFSTSKPIPDPSSVPTSFPGSDPTASPLADPTGRPSASSTSSPSALTTNQPIANPSSIPSSNPSSGPAADPTYLPSAEPTAGKTSVPTAASSSSPSSAVTTSPSPKPSAGSTLQPSALTTNQPVPNPSSIPSSEPTFKPIADPSSKPSSSPSSESTSNPSSTATDSPTSSPGGDPTPLPVADPSVEPSSSATGSPSFRPTLFPSRKSKPTPMPLDAKPSGYPSIYPSFRPSSVPSSGAPTSISTGRPNPRNGPGPGPGPKGGPGLHVGMGNGRDI